MRSDHCSIPDRFPEQRWRSPWPTKLFDPGRDRKGMQLLRELVAADGAAQLCPSQYVESASLQVYDGRGRNSDLGADEPALNVILRWNSLALGLVEKADLPERRIARAVDVEGVDAVVLCGNVQDIVRTFARHLDRGQIQRLRIDRAVDLENAKFAELLRVDVLRS